jgi:hypothetical protein
MSHRLRLLAAGLSVALTGGALAAAPSPAGAATSKSFAYNCTGMVTTMAMVPGPPPLFLPMPMLTSVPVSVTAPLTVTLPDTPSLDSLAPGEHVSAIPVTGSLEVGWLLTTVGGLLQTVGAAVTMPLAGAGTPLSLPLNTSSPVAVGDLLLGDQLPLAGSIPAFTAPTVPDAYPVSASTTLTISLSNLTSGFTNTNLLNCTLANTVTAAQRVLTTLGVVKPAVGTGPGPVVSPSAPPVVDASRANPCVATPARKAGQRATKMRTSTVKRSWKKRPAIKLTVKANGRAAKGTAIACYGAMKIGQKKLRKGKATLKTLRFYPGRYRVKVVYLGSAKARPKAKTITLRVKR